MVLLSFLLVWPLAGAGLFAFLRKNQSRGERWRLALGIGAAVGLTRAALACSGAFMIGHVDNWIQFPAYFLMMLAMPELALMPFSGSWLRVDGWAVYVRLAAMVVACTIAFALAIALMVDARRARAIDPAASDSP